MARTRKATITNNTEYMSNGVSITPAVPSAGEKIKIQYDGLLAKSGATHIFAHVGFGSDWEDKYDYQMKKTSTGFEADVSVVDADTLNLCFKDCASNWDNNSGQNYSFDIM